MSLNKEIRMTLKPRDIIIQVVEHSLNLILLMVDNSLHGSYGDITSTLKFN